MGQRRNLKKYYEIFKIEQQPKCCILELEANELVYFKWIFSRLKIDEPKLSIHTMLSNKRCLMKRILKMMLKGELRWLKYSGLKESTPVHLGAGVGRRARWDESKGAAGGGWLFDVLDCLELELKFVKQFFLTFSPFSFSIFSSAFKGICFRFIISWKIVMFYFLVKIMDGFMYFLLFKGKYFCSVWNICWLYIKEYLLETIHLRTVLNFKLYFLRDWFSYIP